jgi:hypothetical protein
MATKLRERIAPEVLPALDEVVSGYAAEKSLDIEAAVRALRAIHASLAPSSWDDYAVSIEAWSHVLARRIRDRDVEPTITPEQTLCAAGISTKRQARYQRRMSGLLAGRE